MKIISTIIGTMMILAGLAVALKGRVSLGQLSGKYFYYGNEKYLIAFVFIFFGLYMIYVSLKKRK